MKAWLVREKDEFCASVVFAETTGKAMSLALCTDCCEGATFTDIEVHRMAEIDKHYQDGKWLLDWENPQDRIVLVNECGFTCDYDAFDLGECEICSATQYCGQYKDYLISKGGAE